jgi:hypothetical protein
MPDMVSILAFFKGVCSGQTGFSGPPILSLVFYGTAVVLYHAWGWPKDHREHLASYLSRSPAGTSAAWSDDLPDPHQSRRAASVHLFSILPGQGGSGSKPPKACRWFGQALFATFPQGAKP